ncbi:hypothetical protein PRZ48_015042 [Zasmidium cellare]|uniref:Protein sip5 n=1 Tax=Zasmidium cellare TaxID=395010 RepID=A0ABR0DXG9_ZASCE|nr:hypothetical protein PRZ48_015042 [Zasmidium cellare]
MGNSSSKDERRAAQSRHGHGHATTAETSPTTLQAPNERLAGRIYSSRNGSARGSRHDLSFLHLGRGDRENETAAPERPRETKQEREARRAERERQARLKERERSMREEHVDGGYLVTLGVYTGAEDFSKPIVRQLQIERRLAPFWKGLEDHNESWTEAQLVAAARGLPIPEPDAVPPDMARTGSQASSNPRASDANINSLTVPITSRSQSYQSDRSANLSASHPAFSSNSGPSSPTSPNSNNPLFRGRAKTLASTLTGKSQSGDLTPQEIRLPNDPNVNGQPLEAYLYKDASECPICFMYYPPYLNKTRCCDQPICSECFVQIKRPDPHPPEHEQPGQPRPPEEEAEMLVSEVAACPFCVTPEFGVTYEPPPMRRGLAYAHQQNPLRNPTSAMSSSTSLQTGGRRRATSLSASDPHVITTDRVRPDWAKKLADARAHALRRSAAATALHNAAYVLGNQGDGSSRGGISLGRRRRTLFGDSPNASGSGTPREGMSPAEYDAYFRPSNRRQGEGNGNGDLVAGRSSSRRNRVEDLEDLMMMEAIRLSLAAEEERKRKEEKEAQKDAKKKAKADRKEEKKAEKLAKKNGSSGSLYHVGTNDSSSTWASTSMARSTSNLGTQPRIPEEDLPGKGKQPAQDFAGFNPLQEPTSTLNREASPSPPTTASEAQRHLEESRANLQPPASAPISTPSNPRSTHLRQLSNASSAASSFVESPTPGSLRAESNMPNASGLDVTAGAQQLDGGSNLSSGAVTPAAAATNNEPMFNFRSLAAMIGEEDKAEKNEHIEHAGDNHTSNELRESSPTNSPSSLLVDDTTHNRSRGDSGESSSSAPPPIYIEGHRAESEKDAEDEISPAPGVRHELDQKEFGRVNVDVAAQGQMH